MRATNKKMKRSIISKMSVAVALGAISVATPTLASAQIDLGGALGGDLMESISKQLSEAIMKATSRRVMLTPAIVNIDATAKTATVEFSNTTEDTLIAAISVGNTPPMGLGAAPDAAKQAGGLLADDEPAKEEKAIDAKSSLASWIKGAPEKITLAPGEKKQVTVKLDVPAGTADGEYSAWILATTEPGVAKPAKEGEPAKIEIKFEGADGKPGLPKLTTGTKLVYRVVAPK